MQSVTNPGAMTSFNGLIYAPNAPVNIDTGNAGNNFQGAVVGNNLSVFGNGVFYYNPSSVNPGGGGTGVAPGPGYTLAPTTQKYYVLSWQETTN
jgi:hypothetical protein